MRICGLSIIQYMVFLNLWSLHNMREAKRMGVCLGEVKKLSVTGKMFCEDFVHVLVTMFDRGPP